MTDAFFESSVWQQELSGEGSLCGCLVPYGVICCSKDVTEFYHGGVSEIKTKGVHEMKWLSRHIISQHVTTSKRFARSIGTSGVACVD